MMKKGVLWKKCIKKFLVEMKIPTEEVENEDELVRMGYYGRDVIFRRRATQHRPRRWFVKAEGGNII